MAFFQIAKAYQNIHPKENFSFGEGRGIRNGRLNSLSSPLHQEAEAWKQLQEALRGLNPELPFVEYCSRLARWLVPPANPV
jgi:hypothetical protein